MAFRNSIGLANKLKIELISNLSEKVGFFCFDWFILNSFTGFKVRNLVLDNNLLRIESFFLFLDRFGTRGPFVASHSDLLDVLELKKVFWILSGLALNCQQ